MLRGGYIETMTASSKQDHMSEDENYHMVGQLWDVNPHENHLWSHNEHHPSSIYLLSTEMEVHTTCISLALDAMIMFIMQLVCTAICIVLWLWPCFGYTHAHVAWIDNTQKKRKEKKRGELFSSVGTAFRPVSFCLYILTPTCNWSAWTMLENGETD